MFQDLRRPPFLVGVACLVLAFGLETGPAWLSFVTDNEVPGYGIGAIGLVDSLLVLSVGLMTLSLFLSHAVYGRLHAIVSLVVSILVLIACFVGFFRVLAELMLMIALLTSFFGIPIYWKHYASFDITTAALLLTLGMVAKQGSAVLLVVANQRFLTSKSLVLLVLTSLAAGLLVSLLQGFPPRFLASITDAIAALVVMVLAGLWALYTLFGSLLGLTRVVRSLT